MGQPIKDADFRDLLRTAPQRYESFDITLTNWRDGALLLEAVRRFQENPHLARWLRWRNATGSPVRTTDEAYRASYHRPAFHRQETHGGPEGQLLEIVGGDGETTWSWSARSGETLTQEDRSVSASVQDDQGHRWVLYGQRAIHHTGPIVAHWFHPIVGELVEPLQLLATDPIFNFIRTTAFAGRSVHQVKALLPEWGTTQPWELENLPPADEYEWLVDSRTGVILRLECRLDGRSFSLREAIEVAFDLPFKPSAYAPPSPPASQP
jgi:hypothetical protein